MTKKTPAEKERAERQRELLRLVRAANERHTDPDEYTAETERTADADRAWRKARGFKK